MLFHRKWEVRPDGADTRLAVKQQARHSFGALAVDVSTLQEGACCGGVRALQVADAPAEEPPGTTGWVPNACDHSRGGVTIRGGSKEHPSPSASASKW